MSRCLAALSLTRPRRRRPVRNYGAALDKIVAELQAELSRDPSEPQREVGHR
jgi:hypothetical protein